MSPRAIAVLHPLRVADASGRVLKFQPWASTDRRETGASFFTAFVFRKSASGTIEDGLKHQGYSGLFRAMISLAFLVAILWVGAVAIGGLFAAAHAYLWFENRLRWLEWQAALGAAGVMGTCVPVCLLLMPWITKWEILCDRLHEGACGACGQDLKLAELEMASQLAPALVCSRCGGMWRQRDRMNSRG